MNDLKNIFIAWVSSASTVLAAIETRTLITIVSAIILPIIFFAIGKAIDIWLQLHLKRRETEDDK